MNNIAEQVEAEMPRYMSHKKVWALELSEVWCHPDDCGWRLSFADKGYASIHVGNEMFARYKPVPGDFYVQYEDGYKSFSPRKAFIDGYKREA